MLWEDLGRERLLSTNRVCGRYNLQRNKCRAGLKKLLKSTQEEDALRDSIGLRRNNGNS